MSWPISNWKYISMLSVSLPYANVNFPQRIFWISSSFFVPLFWYEELTREDMYLPQINSLFVLVPSPCPNRPVLWISMALWYPSILHTTSPSVLSQTSSHTVPQRRSWNTSTRPSWGPDPFTRRTRVSSTGTHTHVHTHTHDKYAHGFLMN